MVERQKNSFGLRGTSAPPGARPLAGSPSPARPAQAVSPHVIYREGETERPTFHDSYIEKHWPKYGAVAAAVFALGYSLYDGKQFVPGLILVPILFGALSYLAMNGLRKSLNNVHTARTQLFRSPAFLAGAIVGFGYFIYSTFISPQMVMGVEWGVQTAFDDGIQQKDFGAVAVLILKAAGYMVGAGIAVEFVVKKIRGNDSAGGQNNAR